jgi:PAS domain-containing protein
MSIEPNRTTLDYLNHPQDFEPEFNFSKYSQDFKAFSTPLSWAVVLSTFIFSLSLLFAKTIDFSDFLRIFISNTLMIVTISYFRNPTIGISLFIIILEDTLKPLNLMHLVFSYVPCMIFCKNYIGFIACRNIRHWHLTFFFKTCLYFFASSFGLVDVIITYFSIFPVFMVCEKIFRKIYISTEEIIRKNTHCPDFIQIVPLPFAVLDMSFRILANNSAFGDFFDYKLPSSRVFHKLFDPSCQNVLKNLLSKASEKAMGEEEVIVKILNKKLSVIVNAGIGKWGGNDAVFVCVTNASSCEAQKDLMAGAVKLVAESIDDEIENEEISKKNKGKILEFIIRTKDAEILKEYVDGEMNFGVVDFDIVQEVIKIRHVKFM